ncbi:hypothetical protein H2199_003581 [Coniosporium tulheliwenetii]|uniref:Uncharacterized protein n=1 Tax=Coniosporium tulheliwenetii TaxID=3383036 RepID=A0ACC2ZBG0_9PEZI|nr:hypothetical protein H2199_003581 [Cladosporium sp. JES 115]
MPPKRKASGSAEAGPSKRAKTSDTSNDNEQASASPTAAGAPQDDSAGQNPTPAPASGEAQGQPNPVAAQPNNQAQVLLQDGQFVADGIRYNSPLGTQATSVLPNQRSAPIWSPLTVLPYEIQEPVPRKFTRQAAAAEQIFIRRETEVRHRLAGAASFAARRLFWRIRHLKCKDGAFRGDFCKKATDPKAACLAYLQPSDSLWEINEKGQPVHENGTFVTEDEMKQAGYDPAKEKHGVESLVVNSDIRFRIACNQPKDTSGPAAELPERLREVRLTIWHLHASCTKHSCEAAGFFLETDQLAATKLNGQLLSQLQPQAGSKAPYLYKPLIKFNVIELNGLPIFFWRSPKDRAYKIEPGMPAGDAADPKSKDDTVPEKDFHLVHELLVPVVVDAGAETPPPDVPADPSRGPPQQQPQVHPQAQPQDQTSQPVNGRLTVVPEASLEKLNCVLRAQHWPVLTAPGNLEEVNPKQAEANLREDQRSRPRTVDEDPVFHFKAGLYRWRNAFRQYQGERYERVPYWRYLQDEHLFLAIAAVTEAITEWGSYSFSLIDTTCMAAQQWDDSGMLAARPRRPLFLPIAVRDEDDEDYKRNHFFLAVAHFPGNDPQQKPRMLWYDSSLTVEYGPNKNPELLPPVCRWIKNLQWSRDDGHGGDPAPDLEIVRVSAALQQNGDACGIHTILNAWSFAFGSQLNTRFVATDKFYKLAAEVIDLAIAGHIDFWTIYAFLKSFKYILGDYDMAKGRHFPVTRGFRILQDLTDLHRHVRHGEDVKTGFVAAADVDPYQFNGGAQDGIIQLTTASSSQIPTAAGAAPNGLEAPPISHQLLEAYLISLKVDPSSGEWKEFVDWVERTENLAAEPQGGS